MQFTFRIFRTQTAQRSIRAVDEEAATKKLRDELNQPYGFFGRWETAAVEVELVSVESTPISQSQVAGDGPLLLSVKDAAVQLGVSRGTMYELLNRGEIESVRIGNRRLISREALVRFVEANSTGRI